MAGKSKTKKHKVLHRIEELRLARELTQEDVANAIGRNKWFISRLELGAQELDLPTAIQIANFFDVELSELVALTTTTPNRAMAFVADVKPYKPNAGEKPLVPTDQANSLYIIETNACANLGHQQGDVIEVKTDAKAVRSVQIGEVVVVNYHPPGESQSAKELLREFVPPNLLITNAKRGHNARSIDLSLEDAQIVGIVVGSPRKARGARN